MALQLQVSYNHDMASPEVVLADALLTELAEAPLKPGGQAPTMGRLQHVRYTHQAMIDLIIRNGDLPVGERLTQNQIAAYFGYTPGWISNILASDSFKAAMAARREEIVDPELKATIKERFEAVLISSLYRLKEKLDSPQVSDRVVLEAAALGARALGHFNNSDAAPPAASVDRLERLSNRLLALQSNVRERVLNAEDGVSVEVVRQAG